MVFKLEWLNYHVLNFNLNILLSKEHNLHTAEMHKMATL